MRIHSPDSPPTAPRLARVSALTALAVALAWLLSRVFLGLDLTDEMQYYGEIAALTRTGKFFQDDLFLQQLGYLFTLPLFKAHAFFFPDQGYLVLFGRLVFFACYLGAGLGFWRATGTGGRFTPAARMAGLAALFAWLPFQLFALSYNSMSYLLVVAVVAVHLNRDDRRPGRHASALAALLTILTFVYPPVGLVLIALASVEEWSRRGLRGAAAVLALTLAGGGIVLALMFALHGAEFFADLFLAIEFSRGFASGAILQDDALGSWIVLGTACAVAVRRLWTGTTLPLPSWATPGPNLRTAVLVALGAVAAVLLVLSHKWTLGMLPASLLLLMLVGLGACIGPVSTRGAQLALLAGGAVLVLLSVRWATGHFATTLYVSLVALLAAFAPAASRPEVAKLVLAGTALALVVSFTSSNGIHSFGIGAAGVIPFLVLHLAGGLASSTRPVGPGVIRWLLPPAVTALIVINGALNPYREQRLGNPFERIRDVPAFAGLWTSPARNQTIETFRQFLAANSPENQRLLVVGPHPWLYFVARARPATPMLFMHFSVREENYDLVAKHLFRAGPPDVIVLANSVPRALHARVSEWMAQGAIVQKATLPEDFVQRYFQQTRQEIGREVLVLRRPPPRQP